MNKVGSIVYSVNSGLGILAQNIYDAGCIDKVYIAEHKEYPRVSGRYKPDDIVETPQDLLEECDTLLLIEAPLPNPFDWNIVHQAKHKGLKVILIPMYESTPRSNLDLVDLFVCPSELDLLYYPQDKSVVAEMPNPQFLCWKKRTTAHTFVHNAGHGGIFSRNGTVELSKALPLIKSKDIKIIVRIQPTAPREILHIVDSIDDSRVEIVKDEVSHEELWNEGDVFLFPEKFNGLSLPLQEAYASGMLVMAGDRFPINLWLPTEPLIPVSGYFNTYIKWLKLKIKNAVITPNDIASSIDKWANKDITEYSMVGHQYNLNNLLESTKRLNNIIRGY